MTFRIGIKRFLLFLLLLIATAALVVFLYIRRQKMLNLILPEMTEITLIKADIHSDTAFVEVSAIVVNRAPYPMNIDSIVCDLSLGGTTLVSTSQYVGIRQESGESDTVSFSVNIPIGETRKKIQSLQGSDSTGVSINATIVYSGYRLNLARGKQIEVPVPPQLRVIRTEQTELNLAKKNVKVDLFLQIINDGKNLSLSIEDLQYDLTISNDLTTKGKYKKDVYIEPFSATVLKFSLDFTMINPKGTIRKIWTDNDRVPFRLMLSGYLSAGKMKRIPVVLFVSGELELVNEVKKKADKKKKRKLKRAR